MMVAFQEPADLFFSFSSGQDLVEIGILAQLERCRVDWLAATHRSSHLKWRMLVRGTGKIGIFLDQPRTLYPWFVIKQQKNA